MNVEKIRRIVAGLNDIADEAKTADANGADRIAIKAGNLLVQAANNGGLPRSIAGEVQRLSQRHGDVFSSDHCARDVFRYAVTFLLTGDGGQPPGGARHLQLNNPVWVAAQCSGLAIYLAGKFRGQRGQYQLRKQKPMTTKQYEASLAFAAAGGNTAQAAKALGISQTAFRNRIELASKKTGNKPGKSPYPKTVHPSSLDCLSEDRRR